MFWIFLIYARGTRVITAIHRTIYSHCMFLSGHISLRMGAEKAGGGKKKDNVPHAPAAVRMLVDIFASQQQPVITEPEMDRKDLLERKAVPSRPGNGSKLSAIILFLLKSQQDDSQRQRGEAGDRCASPWWILWSVKILFSFIENKSRAVVFIKNHTWLPQCQHVFYSLRHYKWCFYHGACFIYMWSFIGRGITNHIIPSCCLRGGNIFQHLTHKIAFGGHDCTSWPLQRRERWSGMRRSCRIFWS